MLLLHDQFFLSLTGNQSQAAIPSPSEKQHLQLCVLGGGGGEVSFIHYILVVPILRTNRNGDNLTSKNVTAVFLMRGKKSFMWHFTSP